MHPYAECINAKGQMFLNFEERQILSFLKKSVNAQNIVRQNSKQTKHVSQQFYTDKYDHSYKISVGGEIFLGLSNIFLMKIQTFLC